MSFQPEADAYAELTRRPLIVVDVETTKADDSKIQRLIWYAIVPVIGGKVQTRQGLERPVNPGIPIHPDSTRVHGITDADIAGLPGFDAHVLDILALLEQPGAIFVAHNAAFDVTVLRNEFELLGLSMPDLPVIDTMVLPHTIGYNAASLTTQPALPLLAQVLAVPLKNHHNALEDARATAEILTRLLNHAASFGTATDIKSLLVAHGRKRVSKIKDAGGASSRERANYRVPLTHDLEHAWQLPDPAEFPGGADGVATWARWWDHVRLCAEVLCPVLDDDLAISAQHQTTMSFAPLLAAGDKLIEPGQLATLIGAMMRALSPAMSPRQELAWWKKAEPLIEQAPRCTDTQACPDCRKGLPCPLDVAHVYVAAALRCRPTGEITAFDDLKSESPIDELAGGNPRIAGHLLWLYYEDALATGDLVRAGALLGQAEANAVHGVDPQLAIAIAGKYVGRRDIAGALSLLEGARRAGSTDPAMEGVEAAMIRIAAQQTRTRKETTGTPTPAMRRPEHRVRPNPFRPWEQ